MTLATTTRLLSRGTFTASQFTAAVTSHQPRTRYSDAEVMHLAERTIHWCVVFGFNHDLVMAQMAHETDWFRFTGDVKFGQHNFAGLGATGGVPGHSFPDIEAGVLAVVAHHAVYRWGEKSKWPGHLQQYAGEHIDPRYDDVLATGNAGKMIVLGDYRGTWAVPGRTYPESLITRSKQIAVFPKGEELPVSDAQIPGFKWHPADRDHYQPGRTTKIRGGAQHYTAGTNSLNWLTTTPGTQVSATFLVKHNPTLEDRGWQLVRIEDTAWTTAFANPYTVSIEYEHTGKGPIPDAAYAVLAQTWRDIAAYVERHNLGKITPDTSSLKGHKDWVGNPGLICPDGIDIDRIIREWKALITETDALVIAGNPYDAKIIFGFRDMFLRVGAALYPDDPIAGGLTVFGYPMDDEYETATGSAQVFERVVMQWHRDTQPPFDVVASLRNEPIPEPVEDAA